MKLLTWTLGVLVGAGATLYLLQLTKSQKKEERTKSWDALARQRPFPKVGPGPDRKPVGNDDVIDAVRFAISWLREQSRRQ